MCDDTIRPSKVSVIVAGSARLSIVEVSVVGCGFDEKL